MSTRKSVSGNWLLVQWKSGGHDVVFERSVVSPVDKEFKTGDELTVNRRGEQELATLVASAQDRKILEAMLIKDEPTPGPSGLAKVHEDEEDYSCSSSDHWLPSDDDELSCDSEVESKKIKLERYKRQYSRSNKKVMTPSNRAPAVPVNISKKKSSTGTMNLTKNKSLPDSTKLKPHVTAKINIEDVEDINKTFKMVLKIIKKMKGQCHSEGIENTKQHTQSTSPSVNNEESLQLSDNQSNHHTDENKENDNENKENVNGNSENEEFNRSNDNVLISNKYNNFGAKKGQRKIAENEEWIPIGSGKTLIHKDEFKKINWKSYTIATRTLLLAVFPRRILATSSLTGKRPPAFQHKPAKMPLDQKIVCDVIYEVMDRFNVPENLVRGIITTKCADESKMLKARLKKKTACKNKENATAPAVE